MPTFELEESTFAGFIEDDEVYAARVESVRVAEKPYTDDAGNKVKKVEFKFTLIDPDGPHDGDNLWGETTTKFNTHPDCKLRNWSQAILGQVLPAGYVLDTDVLVGQECRVIIGWKEYEDKDKPIDPATGKRPMKERNWVKEVMPTSEAMDRMAHPNEEPF